MNFRLLFKIGTILLLLLVLMIPMLRIHDLVRERQQLRDAVVKDIARATGYAQKITGPLLVVPYSRTVTEWEATASGGSRQVTRTVTGQIHLLPEELELQGKLATAERRRGIYRARVFDADTGITARFAVPAHYGIEEQRRADYEFGEPLLVLGISDIRGIGNGLSVQLQGRALAFEPGTATALLGAGVHAPLGSRDARDPWQLEVAVAMDLQGTGSFSVTPVGRQTRVTLESDWPHPGFRGEYLPRSRDITERGFVARWQTSFFATNLPELLDDCVNAGASGQPGCAAFEARSFGVEFVDPVDHYLRSERATKYAFLFIGLTFAAFFLFEVLRRFSVHPVQYALVGLSLAVFFLLLLALSEQVGFAAAYVTASTACVLLNGYYVAHVLGGLRHGLYFGAALAGLYGLLYGILASEDYALLMGTLLVCAVLGAAMVLTRNVNWARVGERA